MKKPVQQAVNPTFRNRNTKKKYFNTDTRAFWCGLAPSREKYYNKAEHKHLCICSYHSEGDYDGILFYTAIKEEAYRNRLRVRVVASLYILQCNISQHLSNKQHKSSGETTRLYNKTSRHLYDASGWQWSLLRISVFYNHCSTNTSLGHGRSGPFLTAASGSPCGSRFGG